MNVIRLPQSGPLLSFSIPMEFDGWQLDVDYTVLPQQWHARHDLPDVDVIGVRQQVGQHSVEIPVDWFSNEQRAWLRDEALTHYEGILSEADDFRQAGLL